MKEIILNNFIAYTKAQAGKACAFFVDEKRFTLIYSQKNHTHTA